MKKNILPLVLLFATITAIAQDNVGRNNIPAMEDSTKISKELDSDSLKSPSLYTPSIFLQLPFNYISSPYSNTLNNPFTWNFNLNSTTSPSQFRFMPYNEQVTHFGLGSYENRGTSWIWMPTDRLLLDGSAFISQQYGFILSSYQRAYGINLGLKYNLTDILKLRVWGQYVTPAEKDIFINASGLFPKTKVGTELIVEPKDNLKIGTGVESQYNRTEKKWDLKSGGKVTIGF